jgi:ubiquinone/menaquinone biosynthesis C-methylase UbiE
MSAIDSSRLTRWYNAQARFYSKRRNTFDGAHVQWVAGRLDDGRELRILDAACGTGLFTIGLARLGPRWRVEGVDLAEGMLEVGREHATTRGLGNAVFATGNVERLEQDDASVDVVVAAGLLPNLNDPGPALAEFRRVLRPGGPIYLVEIDRDALTTGDRLSFHAMVLGYRVISTVLPRYKFARGWSLERSTIDPVRLEALLPSAGFRPGAVHRADKHVIVEAFKG